MFDFDDVEDLRVNEAPVCGLPIGNEPCDGDGLYDYEVGYQGRRAKVLSCKFHAKQAQAFMTTLFRAAYWVGEYSQVSGIESALPAESVPFVMPAITIERVERAAETVQEIPALAIEPPKPVRVAPTPTPRQRETIDRVTRGLNGMRETPPPFDPDDPRVVNKTHWYCATEIGGVPCGDWFVRGGESQHAAKQKHQIPTYMLKLLPEGKIKCDEREDHIAAGCRRTFEGKLQRSRHYGGITVPPITLSQKPAIEAIPFQRPSEDDARTTA